MHDYRQGTAMINGAAIAYEIVGAGPALTFIHAGITDRHLWDHQFATVATDYRVLRYDLRGFGESSLPAAPYSMREDLHELLQHCGITHTHLVGASMGGSIAIDFTLDYPAMVDSLVLVGAGIGGQAADPALDQHWQALAAATERGDLDAANELELRLWVDATGRTAGPIDPVVRAQAALLNRAVLAREGEFAHARSIDPLTPPAINRLHEITAPTLVIVGACDIPLIRTGAKILSETIPNVQQIILPEVAHLPPLEAPAVFNQHVLTFLAAQQG